MPDIQTLSDIYFHSIDSYPKPDAFRRKVDGRYQDISRKAFAEAGNEIALGLVSLGLERGDRVALLSENRLEWVEADMGILTAALISVPIYPSLLAGPVEYLIEDCGARAVLVSGKEQGAKLQGLPHEDLTVIAFEDAEGIPGAISLEELRKRGRALGQAEPELHRRRAEKIKPDDLATIIYTSGTTGLPKGVMLTHRNIASNVVEAMKILKVEPTDVALSFLPLSHILERMAGLYVMVYSGATIAFAEDVKTVAENMGEVRPTLMISVPRLYEKIYARVHDNAVAGGAMKLRIFHWANAVGRKRSAYTLEGKSVPGFLELKYKLADKLVFSKLRARTGGRLRFFVSGGAPLSKEIAEFFYAAGLIILEGYGLTETSPVIAVNRVEKYRPGTVGPLLPGVEVKFAEDGEILTRGPNVMIGYYNMPEETEKVLEDGWFSTGDIGFLDDDGFLHITDRKKDILVTAGGKNVPPQPIENALKTDKYITEAVALGDRRPFLVAVIVPAFENLEEYAHGKGISFSGPEELVENEAIREFLMERVRRSQTGCASFEAIKKILVLPHELTIENGEITPTLKVKRKAIVERYGDRIEALYQR